MLIPPGTRIQDKILTPDIFSLPDIGYWDGQRQPTEAGNSISVFMPLEINGSVMDYKFELRAMKVE